MNFAATAARAPSLAVLLALAPASTASAQAPAPEPVEIRAAVLRVDSPGPAPISRLDLPPADLGLAGAKLATADNATTGRFMGQSFALTEAVASPETVEAEMAKLLEAGIPFIVVLADAETTAKLADQAGEAALIFNAGATDDSLRAGLCRANLLHTAPSDAMLADALAQFLIWKRWDDWLLVSGSHPEDKALAEAYRRAAKKFGARIVEERTFEDAGGARRTDSGHAQIQAQLPVFMQGAKAHEVVVAADRADVFASWLPYHTWEPRLVTGSAGLRPVSWHPAHEAWGATQWQTRFERQSARPARPEDYQAWAALRAVGEAASRTKSGDFATLSAYVRGDQLQLAAFKGQALSFRPWDGQLRQPILLASGPVTASVSPQEQFLHQVSQLDSLGIDRPETACKF
ncbi:ABC transporter substrate-binding protein [Neomegalonema sp.]|uniref:ABC transporter substrate-binding protein n=1 Tax=Neomegalonema sp. TaxID=2039713 RepID=UPI00261F054C|nr:ABC transporter substrate-binding protein [Neomegalonema sp.]MDD2867283.1 ABC transporter substrate-binding protein [Neomegalonema sp.]